MGKKQKSSELGRSLARKQKQHNASKRHHLNTPAAEIAAAVGRHSATDQLSSNLVSVLDATDLEELMLNATLANQSFVADRYPTPIASSSVVVVAPPAHKPAASSQNPPAQQDSQELRIPRRPPWSSDMSYDELMTAEMTAFLEWRRRIASLDNHYTLTGTASFATTITPFEKNLEVWRQLWRVVERSDIILQIVDARNPLLYLCDDLVRYVVSEMHRAHMLVMNKADLLSSHMISRWHDYFAEHNINVVFFSAFKESVGEEKHDSRVIGAPELIERLQSAERLAPVVRDDGRVVVGLCGYPNVGKSSTINVLLESVAKFAALDAESNEFGEKSLHHKENLATAVHDNGDEDADGNEDGNNSDDERILTNCDTVSIAPTTAACSQREGVGKQTKRVAVSATPGRTKHFQTLVLTDRVLLCDCPGLVFPNFSSSKAELICAGVLSIDNMRGDYLSPVSLISRRVPVEIFEGVYGLRFAGADVKQRGHGSSHEGPRDDTSLYVSGEKLLETHARARGFMTDHGRPDSSRSARVVLKDFVNGKLVFAHGPDGKGESGVGANVFAKKGQLVYERSEAERKRHESSTEEDEGESGEAGSEKSKLVKAFVSGSKKTGGREFFRVNRSFFPPEKR